ncbi:MAG: hypothetical protein ACRDRR_14910 [Pseudonocardiaceae bacterium]
MSPLAGLFKAGSPALGGAGPSPRRDDGARVHGPTTTGSERIHPVENGNSRCWTRLLDVGEGQRYSRLDALRRSPTGIRASHERRWSGRRRFEDLAEHDGTDIVDIAEPRRRRRRCEWGAELVKRY